MFRFTYFQVAPTVPVIKMDHAAEVTTTAATFAPICFTKNDANYTSESFHTPEICWEQFTLPPAASAYPDCKYNRYFRLEKIL